MFHSDFEEKLPYSVLTLVALAVFYAIYFGKMLAQKRRGIRTRQIGSCKEKSLHTIELLMSVATLGIVPAQILSIVFGLSCLPGGVRFTGFLIALLGDGIFLAAVLCMRDSWRAGIPAQDKTEIVTTGIYAFSRNPAFLGFDFMYIGVLLLYCNPLTAAFTAFAIVILHLQILQEEKYMAATFGATYLAYRKKVLRYLGRK